jgi:hypothetical protein
MLQKERTMLKTSFIRALSYAGVFAFGYTAADLNIDHISIEPETPSITHLQMQNAQGTNCPIAVPIQPETTAETPAEVSTHFSEAPQQSAAQETLEDFDNPDEQIKLALTEDPVAFTQANERPVQDPDPLEPLFRLPEDQQLAYIQKLVESQEDAAVVALNDLILNDNPPVQKAAIDGLLSLLEMRTGHFALIAENIEQNSVFLNGDQLERFNKAR